MEYLNIALRLGDALVADQLDDGSWRSQHPIAQFGNPNDLNTGSSGALVALTEIARKIDLTIFYNALVSAAEYQFRSEISTTHPGLYIGEGGRILALLKVGALLGDDRYIKKSSEIAKCLHQSTNESPDLFNGIAGQIRYQCCLFRQTADEEHIEIAEQLAIRLISRSHGVAENVCYWRIPNGYEGLSDKVLVGYSHGAAGIADALLDLYSLCPSQALKDAIDRVLNWLRAVVPNEHQLDAQYQADSSSYHPKGSLCFWCHGSPGIARFLLRALRAGFGGVEQLCSDCLDRTVLNSRWSGPSQCHGLAGNLEILIDAYQTLREPKYLSNAHQFAQLLSRFLTSSEDGMRTVSDVPFVTSPDLMLGYPGIALAFLRLSDPLHSRHALSLDSFDDPKHSRGFLQQPVDFETPWGRSTCHRDLIS